MYVNRHEGTYVALICDRGIFKICEKIITNFLLHKRKKEKYDVSIYDMDIFFYHN
jgi:hypothetical protein